MGCASTFSCRDVTSGKAWSESTSNLSSPLLVSSVVACWIPLAPARPSPDWGVSFERASSVAVSKNPKGFSDRVASARALLDIGDVIDIELLGEEKPDPEEGEEGCIP